MDFEHINNELVEILCEKFHEQWQRVLNQPMCDIDSTFLGFVEIYYHLAQLIPEHFTVIDFGCAFNPQAYYFKNHKEFIAVDSSNCEKFEFENTWIKNVSLEKELENWKGKDTSQVFAICSYVPADTLKLREVFKNLFVYYPCKETPIIKFKNKLK